MELKCLSNRAKSIIEPRNMFESRALVLSRMIRTEERWWSLRHGSYDVRLSTFIDGFCRFAPFSYLYKSWFNEPELGAGIDPGMALNVDHFHLVYWIRQNSNSQPSDRQLSLLTTRLDFAHVYRMMISEFVFFLSERFDIVRKSWRKQTAN